MNDLVVETRPGCSLRGCKNRIFVWLFSTRLLLNVLQVFGHKIRIDFWGESDHCYFIWNMFFCILTKQQLKTTMTISNSLLDIFGSGDIQKIT